MTTGSSEYAEDDFITVTDVMKKYGMSRPTVWRNIHNGTLPAYRIGDRFTRLRASEVDAAFRRTTEQATR